MLSLLKAGLSLQQKKVFSLYKKTLFIFVGLVGLEPTTKSLWAICSTIWTISLFFDFKEDWIWTNVELIQ